MANEWRDKCLLGYRLCVCVYVCAFVCVCVCVCNPFVTNALRCVPFRGRLHKRKKHILSYFSFRRGKKNKIECVRCKYRAIIILLYCSWARLSTNDENRIFCLFQFFYTTLPTALSYFIYTIYCNITLFDLNDERWYALNVIFFFFKMNCFPSTQTTRCSEI